jgi:hypothetical protein
VGGVGSKTTGGTLVLLPPPPPQLTSPADRKIEVVRPKVIDR